MIPSPISTSGRFDVSTFPDPSLPCSLPSCLRAFVPPCLPRSLPSSLLASPPRCLVASLPFFPPNKPTNPRGAIKKAVCVKKTNPTRTQTNPPVPSPKRQRGVPFQSPKRQRGACPEPRRTARITAPGPTLSEPQAPARGMPETPYNGPYHPHLAPPIRAAPARKRSPVAPPRPSRNGLHVASFAIRFSPFPARPRSCPACYLPLAAARPRRPGIRPDFA